MPTAKKNADAFKDAILSKLGYLQSKFHFPRLALQHALS